MKLFDNLYKNLRNYTTFYDNIHQKDSLIGQMGAIRPIMQPYASPESTNSILYGILKVIENHFYYVVKSQP